MRAERLERQRSLLVAKERDSEEREQRARAEADETKAEQQAQLRKARGELSALRAEHAEVKATLRELQHERELREGTDKAEKTRAKRVEDELDQATQELRDRAVELAEEHERRGQLETELERARASQSDVANAEVVKDELHRWGLSSNTPSSR